MSLSSAGEGESRCAGQASGSIVLTSDFGRDQGPRGQEVLLLVQNVFLVVAYDRVLFQTQNFHPVAAHDLKEKLNLDVLVEVVQSEY
ncbi:MAG: hypothetical protein LQ351_005743 [Letrouitia transgressa]|nr:MAG: hypothetical protein LQ351_005743 [Letrouitia transgressa]